MSDREAYAAFLRWLSAWNAYLFGRMQDPRVAEARRQQQAVAGDRWSVKVDPRAFESWSGWTRGRRGT